MYAGLVEERTDGRFRYYRLQAKPLSEVDSWISRYRTYMERQLDALGHVLDTMPDDLAEPEAPSRRTGRPQARPPPLFEAPR